MANYNGARHLEAAVRSARNQTCADLELIIIDDASADDSAVIAARLAAEDHRIRLILQPENQGPAVARNRGFAEARGQWIAVQDSDDLMHVRRLERLVGEAEAQNADIIVDDMLVFYEDGAAPHLFLEPWRGPRKRWVTTDEYLASGIMFGKGLSFGPLKPVFRAAAIRASGLRYNEQLSIGEDFDLVARCLLAGLSLRVDARALYGYRKHRASISHRMRGDQVLAMQRAASALPCESGSAELQRAWRRFRASLEVAYALGEAVEAMKARRWFRALDVFIRQPRALPLLAVPLAARLARAAGALSRRRPSNQAPGELENIVLERMTHGAAAEEFGGSDDYRSSVAA